MNTKILLILIALLGIGLGYTGRNGQPERVAARSTTMPASPHIVYLSSADAVHGQWTVQAAQTCGVAVLQSWADVQKAAQMQPLDAVLVARSKFAELSEDDRIWLRRQIEEGVVIAGIGIDIEPFSAALGLPTLRAPGEAPIPIGDDGYILFQALLLGAPEDVQAMRDAGLCRKVGISLYASDDPVGVARRFRPDVVQAPASLLDQRLLVDGSLATLCDMGVEVHLRSIFLNGLLFLPPDRVPHQLKGAAGRISRARRLIAEGRSDPLQASLGFALSRPEAAAVLVGVTSAAELSAVIAAASSPPPDLDWDEMAIDDPTVLDQRAWAAA
jgi:hypothetical protein